MVYFPFKSSKCSKTYIGRHTQILWASILFSDFVVVFDMFTPTKFWRDFLNDLQNICNYFFVWVVDVLESKCQFGDILFEMISLYQIPLKFSSLKRGRT